MNARTPLPDAADTPDMALRDHIGHAIDLAERCGTRFALLRVRPARDFLVLLNGIAGADVFRLADRIATTLAIHPTQRLAAADAIADIVRYPDDGRDADALTRTLARSAG